MYSRKEKYSIYGDLAFVFYMLSILVFPKWFMIFGMLPILILTLYVLYKMYFRNL